MTIVLNKIIQYGALLFVFLIPWQARWILAPGEINNQYWEYGTISLYVTEIILLVVLIALIVKGTIHFHRHQPSFKASQLYSPLGALVLLVVWAGLTIIWSENRSISLERWTALVEMVALFVILSSEIIPFPRLAWTIIFSALAQSIIGLAQFFTQLVPSSAFFGMARQSADVLGASVVETMNGRWLRAYGTFGHPNILGGWLVLALILIVEKWRRFDKRDILIYLSFVVVLAGLLVTFSRSAWLAFGAMLLYYFVIIVVKKRDHTYALRLIAIAGAVSLIFAGIFFEPFYARIFSQNRLEVRSIEERALGLRESLALIAKHPIQGVGMGNYGVGVYRHIDNTQPAWYYQPVHNVGILAWAELGSIGLLIMLLHVWTLLYRPWRSIPLIEYGMILLPLFILGMLDHYLWSLYAGMMISAVYLSLEFRRKKPNLS